MPVTEEQFREVTTRLENVATELEHLTHGNGRRGFWAVNDAVFGVPGKNDDNGLVGRVDELAKWQAGNSGMGDDVREIKQKVDNLERARERDTNMREGGRRVLVLLGTILTILSGLGAGFGYQVMRTIGELAKQLP